MKKIKLNITGMHCPSCSTLIKDSLEETKGIKKAEISLETNQADITFDESMITEEQVKKIIRKENYGVE